MGESMHSSIHLSIHRNQCMHQMEPAVVLQMETLGELLLLLVHTLTAATREGEPGLDALGLIEGIRQTLQVYTMACIFLLILS